MTTHVAPLPEFQNLRILLIGAGAIAAEYVKALRVLGIGHIGVLSRSQQSADMLVQAYGLKAAHSGGEHAMPELLEQYDAFIVAAPIESLKTYAELFAQAGITRVLLEKPSFLYSSELADFLNRFSDWDAAVALNRLYYPSVEHLRNVIEKEGASSLAFSFTEWTHRIDPKHYAPVVTARWGLSNCIHVIATVFDLIGLPDVLQAQQYGQGRVEWHPSSSIFLGQGISKYQVPFSYQSDWNSAGRWLVTVNTLLGAYTLCPMESLSFTPKGSVQSHIVVEPWNADIKCGFVPMLEAWLMGHGRIGLRSLLPQLQAMESIFGYSDYEA